MAAAKDFDVLPIWNNVSPLGRILRIGSSFAGERLDRRAGIAEADVSGHACDFFRRRPLHNPGLQRRLDLFRLARLGPRDRRREGEPEREEAEILAAKGHSSPLARNEDLCSQNNSLWPPLALATAPPWTKSPA